MTDIESNPFIIRFKTSIKLEDNAFACCNIESNPFIIRFKTQRKA